MKKILFGIFVGLFSISASFAAKVSGKVLDENGDLLIGATVCVLGTNECAVVNLADDGFSFDVPNLKSDTMLVFSYAGYEEKKIAAFNLLAVPNTVVTMTRSIVEMDDLIISKGVGALWEACVGSYEGQICESTSCVEPRYKLKGITCIEQKCGNDKYKGKWVEDGTVNGGRYLVGEFEFPQPDGTLVSKTFTEPQKEEIKRTKHKCVLNCPDGFHQVNDNCRPKTGNCKEDFQGDTTNLDTAEWDDGVCRVKTCKTGYEPNKKDNTCDAIKNCPVRLLKLYNAKSGKYKHENGKESCYDIKCESDKYRFYGDPHNKCLQKCDVSNADKRKGIASKAMADDSVCRVMECNTPQYVLSGTAGTADAKCVNQVGTPCVFQNPPTKFWERVEKTEYIMNGTELKCVVKSCKNKNYKPNDNGTDCIWDKDKCPDEELAKIKYAKTGTWDSKTRVCRVKTCQGELVPNADKTACVCGEMPLGWSEQKLADNGVCYPTGCDEPRYVLETGPEPEDNICKDKNGESCTKENIENLGENSGQIALAYWVYKEDGNLVCEVETCKDGFVRNDDKNGCVYTSGDCPKDMLPENATYGHKAVGADGKSEICIVDGCIGGYDPSSDGMSCVVNAEEQKKIAEAQAKYDLARENEQSLENRMLAATTMGTMGLGGKALAQSMAEQVVDADAERDMAAYLASFRCDYGMGRNIKGGDKNVELPGGSVLIPMYSEYVALANDLKLRKEQLGLKAGIESEPILDSATTGLYDDVSTGITSGTYASLARAMLDPTGADAKMWAEQKEKTQQNLVAGGAAVGVGAVVGIAGNIAHTNAYKNKIEHLEALDDFKDNVDASTEQRPKSCPKGADGTYPNCNCKKQGEYNSNTNTCDKCKGDGISAKDGKCGCYDSGKTLWDEKKQACVEPPKTCEPECKPKPGNHLILDSKTCKCSCDDGFDLSEDGESCKCDSNNKYVQDGKCVNKPLMDGKADLVLDSLIGGRLLPDVSQLKVGQLKIRQTVELANGHLFNFDSSELTDKTKSNLKQLAQNLKAKDKAKICKFDIFGYTDRSGSDSVNQTLSEKRAKAVKDYLEQQLKAQGIEYTVTAEGMGEEYCFCEKGNLTGACSGLEEYDMPEDDTYYAPCRKVVIEAVCYRAQENNEN